MQPPKKGTDYRDVLPPSFEEVVAVYEYALQLACVHACVVCCQHDLTGHACDMSYLS